MAAAPSVLVVGAGIVGASIAWHLARLGARVTIVDAEAPGGIATHASLAWINASWGNPEPYFRLRVRAMREWRRLEREVPGLSVAWSGSLFWDIPPDEMDGFVAEHSSWGYAIRRIDRPEVQRIEPELAHPPESAIHALEEGAVEPSSAAQALLAAAKSMGVTIAANHPVKRLTIRGGDVAGAETDAGPMLADHIVVAAGAATAALVSAVGLTLPMRAPPGLLVTTKPCKRLLAGLVIGPEMHARQTVEGRFVAAAHFEPGENEISAGARLFDGMKAMLRTGASLEFEGQTVGYRPIPKDGFPMVGPVRGIDGLYVAVMHSGVTLAPAVGRFVADEIVKGQRDALLQPYGADRFDR